MQIIDSRQDSISVRFAIDKAEAIRLGRDIAGEVTVTVKPSELTDIERDALATLQRKAGTNETPRLPFVPGYPYAQPRKWGEASLEAMKGALADAAVALAALAERQAHDDAASAELLKRREEENLAAKARHESKVAAALELGPMAFVCALGTPGAPSNTHRDLEIVDLPADQIWLRANAEFVGGKYDPAFASDERIKALLAEAKDLIDAHNAPIQEAQRHARALEEQAAAAGAQRALEQKLQWLKAHGSASQQKRQQRGLLPDSELLDAMRDFYLAPLDRFQGYDKITDQEVLAEAGVDREYAGSEVRFSVSALTSMTAEEFAALEAMEDAAKAIDGQVTITARRHRGFYNDDADVSGEIFRNSLRVEVIVGELTFSRLYACPQPI